MPIDRSHAFGGAGVFQHPMRCLKKILGLMPNAPLLGVKGLLSMVLNASKHTRAAAVWRRFERFTEIHPTCWLGINAWCSAYTSVNPLQAPIVIKENTVVRGLLRIELGGRIVIGKQSYIGDDTILDSANLIELGDYTMVAHSVHIFDNNLHPLDWKERLEQNIAYRNGRVDQAPRPACAPIRIGSHVWIGFNSFIAKGVTIGDRSVVAACTIVTKDVPPDTLVAGNPARIIRKLSS